jgi:hypothetical protein
MLLMASSPGAKASALEIAKHFHFMVEISKLLFILVLMINFDLTNAKISNAELDEQLKEIVRVSNVKV